MAVKISGVLKDGAGEPVQNCTIQLKAKRNSATVVVNTVASENPDKAGHYSMDVECGQYSVILLVDGFPPSHAGTITVYDDSKPGTLNDFLGAVTEDDVRPEALRRFEQMVEEAARNAAAASQSAADAKISASDAAASVKQVADNAKAAADSAREAGVSAAQAKTAAQSASESEKTASASATEASESAVAAESSKSAAATSAGSAKMSEVNAAASEKSAATSASTATTKASEAATSARDAAASEEAAKSSETAAATSASGAATSATDAKNAASAAGVSASNAKTSETAAGKSASEADESRKAAGSSAGEAAKSAEQARGSATTAAESQHVAESAATRSEAAAKRAEEIAHDVSLEDASLTAKGIVQLSSATDSDDETKAATPKAVSGVKAVADNAAGRVSTLELTVDGLAPLASPAFSGTPTAPTAAIDSADETLANTGFVNRAIASIVIPDVPDASLTERGIVQLSNAMDSDDETKAATPKAVKAAMDAAAGKQPHSTVLDTVAGSCDLVIKFLSAETLSEMQTVLDIDTYGLGHRVSNILSGGSRNSVPVGGLIFAHTNNKQINRSQIYSGSDLRYTSFVTSAAAPTGDQYASACTPISGTYHSFASGSSWAPPGTYQAISGGSNVSNCYPEIGLFIRVA